MMQKVRILRRFPYSPDGIRVETWPAGSVREVDDRALGILIAEGACEIIETKAHAAAPENKAGGNVTSDRPRSTRRKPKKG